MPGRQQGLRTTGPATGHGGRQDGSSRAVAESGNRGRKSVVIELRSAVGFRHRPAL
jgi:hypothetical protein